MNKKIILSAFLILGAIVSCKNSENKTDGATADSAKVAAAAPKDSTASKAVYTCPMHPEVVSDKPGQCPKCGMDLELKS